eukprot:CAMPEP_0178942704 /NCGR_PEP_ID=MMETSP0789-20121207/2148_1 /TAXON_ID=3005 /ORGANISM="Rhizosolenia setigera, Strain CCMP 1694" /LENGTH=306 /DNA_ID=CAMNT_0020622155 /DNA_START=63 /DNA_END=980 /DNA_ORIENTATION=-
MIVFAFVLMTIVHPMVLSFSATQHPKRIVLVTGSNKGIGKEIARKIASSNNDNEKKETLCILGCRNEALGKASVQELESEGCNVDFVRIDLTDTSSIADAKKFIEKKYGRCDVLVNNAAVCFNDPTLYGKTEYTPFEKQADITVKTNFFGTLALTKAMLPLLTLSTSPRIINIASSAGRLSILPSQERQKSFSSPNLQINELEEFMKEFIQDAADGSHNIKGWPNTGYGVSKVGIVAMTKILAREYPEIMVNSVDPGYCATDQNNNQGFIPAERGAITPFLLATLNSSSDQFFTGLHWFQEQTIEW